MAGMESFLWSVVVPLSGKQTSLLIVSPGKVRQNSSDWYQIKILLPLRLLVWDTTPAFSNSLFLGVWGGEVLAVDGIQGLERWFSD